MHICGAEKVFMGSVASSGVDEEEKETWGVRRVGVHLFS